MIIILKPDANDEDVQHIVTKAERLGLRAHISRGVERTIIGFIGPEDVLRVVPLEAFPGVESVIPVLTPYKLASREFQKEKTVIQIAPQVKVGGTSLVIMAGPCSIESLESFRSVAQKVQAAGAMILRGGAFKPRTSPYDFQGLGEEGLKILSEVSRELDIPTVTEVIDPRHVAMMDPYVSIYQIGARNMQNFALLKEVGMTQKPVLLKRGMSATVQDVLMSAEYILSKGNFQVMLCERGIRTFETVTRNTFDINAIPAFQQLSHLPVIADPSHGTGRRSMVSAVARAAVAAGCDGLMIEVHENPQEALSDGPQSLLPEHFAQLVNELRAVARAVNREL